MNDQINKISNIVKTTNKTGEGFTVSFLSKEILADTSKLSMRFVNKSNDTDMHTVTIGEVTASTTETLIYNVAIKKPEKIEKINDYFIQVRPEEKDAWVSELYWSLGACLTLIIGDNEITINADSIAKKQFHLPKPIVITYAAINQFVENISGLFGSKVSLPQTLPDGRSIKDLSLSINTLDIDLNNQTFKLDVVVAIDPKLKPIIHGLKFKSVGFSIERVMKGTPVLLADENQGVV